MKTHLIKKYNKSGSSIKACNSNVQFAFKVKWGEFIQYDNKCIRCYTSDFAQSMRKKETNNKGEIK